jgi:CRP-like cAMP-binding protein
VVGTVEPCGTTGDLPLLTGRPAAYTARALTDVQAGYLPAAAFLTLLDENPALARAWLGALARHHFRAQQTLAQTIGGSAECRTAALLLREARDRVVSCAQSTLADMLGLRRPTLNRILKDFEHDDLVRIGYRRIDLLAPERLHLRARGNT